MQEIAWWVWCLAGFLLGLAFAVWSIAQFAPDLIADFFKQLATRIKADPGWEFDYVWQKAPFLKLFTTSQSGEVWVLHQGTKSFRIMKLW
jgi:hypothetical protein